MITGLFLSLLDSMSMVSLAFDNGRVDIAYMIATSFNTLQLKTALLLVTCIIFDLECYNSVFYTISAAFKNILVIAAQRRSNPVD